jgi:DNA mismatch endonuclease (patch repair protein)
MNRITGWRRKQNIFGKPDFIFKNRRIAIFIDGCFWHGCGFHGNIPKTNKTFWKNKIEANKKRDRLVTRILCKQGWKVMRIREHQLNKKTKRNLMASLYKSIMEKPYEN